MLYLECSLKYLTYFVRRERTSEKALFHLFSECSRHLEHRGKIEEGLFYCPRQTPNGKGIELIFSSGGFFPFSSFSRYLFLLCSFLGRFKNA